MLFPFEDDVEELTATGRYRGSPWITDIDGGNRRKFVSGLLGHYHTGANQLWGPNGNYVYYQSRGRGTGCMARIPLI